MNRISRLLIGLSVMCVSCLCLYYSADLSIALELEEGFIGFVGVLFFYAGGVSAGSYLYEESKQ